MRPDSTPRLVFGVALVGILLIQAAWIAAMPAFRGPDEFDHVFRAEGVAHGSIRPGEDVPGLFRGRLTPVRRSVIDAASDVCSSYGYTGYYNCHHYIRTDSTWNLVGSGAAQYNPTYYAVVGNVGRFFDGVGVNYAIRVASGLMCALILAWAASLWSQVGRSRWRTLGFLTALTPVLLYSTAIAAPNGISYAAGVLLWVAGLTLVRGTRVPGRAPLAAAATGAVLICNTHTTGPLWLLLITVSLALLGPARFRTLLTYPRVWATAAIIGIGAFGSVAWTVISGANMSTSNEVNGDELILGEFAMQHVLWLLQAIAVFPLRNEAAPAAVYVLWLVPFGALLALAVQLRGRVLITVLWIAGSVIVTATILTLVSYRHEGYAWQGRYSLPLTVGLALVPAACATGRGLFGPFFDCAAASMVAATGISVWHVARQERDFVQEPLTNHLGGGALLAGLLAALGFFALLWVMNGGVGSRQSTSDPPRSAPLTQQGEPVAGASL